MILKKEIAELKSLVCLYKNENDDYKARCEELEEMLRQEESKLEIANKCLYERDMEIARLKEIKQMYFNALQKLIDTQNN